MIRSFAVVCATGLAALAVAGCGGSDAPPATTAASGGGPASAGSGPATAGDGSAQDGSARTDYMSDETYIAVRDTPALPICNPGGLPNEDEETCQWFWNRLLTWAPVTGAPSRPTLVPATNSMIYEGFTGEQGDTHWFGPELTNCDGTGSIKGNPDYCKGRTPGLEFDKSTNIETYDNGPTTQSTIAWRLSAGDVSFGTEYFTAHNDGGPGGTQWAFCGARSSKGNTDAWVSCSRANAERDGAMVNTTQPPGNDEDYASFGWVVANYPVLVQVQDLVPKTTMTLAGPTAGADVQFSAAGSSPGATQGTASVQGGRQRGNPRNLIWLAGYRTRTGDGTVGISVGLTSATPAFNGTTAEVSVGFGGTTTPECRVRQPQQTPRTRVQCLVRFSPRNAPPYPAVLNVTLRTR